MLLYNFRSLLLYNCPTDLSSDPQPHPCFGGEFHYGIIPASFQVCESRLSSSACSFPSFPGA